MTDFEVVSVPEIHTTQKGRPRQAFEAAVKVAHEGRGVIVRVGSEYEAQRFGGKFCEIARHAGRKGHTQRQANLRFICWVDTEPR